MSSSSLSSNWDSSNDDLIDFDFFDSFLNHNTNDDISSSVNSPTSTIQDSVVNSPTSILQDQSFNDFDSDPKYGSARIFLEKETHLFRHAREVKTESKGGYLEGKNFEICNKN